MRRSATAIRADIGDRLSLTCSVGVAPNKFLAKMASVEAKPRARPNGVEPGPGVFEVKPGEEVAYLHPLPVRRLWGVGPSTYERLSRLGVSTIGDLAAVSPVALQGSLGRANAARLLELAAGIDDRPVESERPVKSVSHEETFAFDLHDRTDIRTQLVRMADGVASRLRASGLGARTISLKVRDATFATHHTITDAAPCGRHRGGDRRRGRAADGHARAGRGVRLLGVVGVEVRRAERAAAARRVRRRPTRIEQWSEASAAIDLVRGRFGSAAIGPASALSGDGLRIVRRGQQQWGTNAERATRETPTRGLR